MAEATTHFSSISDALLACETQGSGTGLVLLHGFPLNRRVWKQQMDSFSHFGRVIVPDLPGFGQSPDQRQPSVPDMAKAVLDLLNALDMRGSVVIAGASLGGYVAFEFFRQFPNRVKAMALFGSRPEPDSEEARRLRLATEEKVRRDGMDDLAKVFVARLLSPRNLNERPELAEQVRNMILENAPRREGVANSLLAMAQRNDSRDLLGRIRVPTLVIAGQEDAIVPVEELRAMAGALHDATFHSIPGAGHLVNIEQPQLFQQACTEFFKRIGL